MVYNPKRLLGSGVNLRKPYRGNFLRRGYRSFQFSPLLLSPLLWLKSNVGTYQSADTSNPAINDGDPVRLWVDQGTNGNNCTQGTASKRPTLRTGVRNGLPVVRFDGVDDCYLFPSQSLNDFTLFILQLSSGDCGLVCNSADYASQTRFGQAANQLSTFDGTNNPSSATLGTARTNWSVIAFNRSGLTVSFYQDGTGYGTGTMTGTRTFAALGGNGVTPGIAQPLNGDLLEVVLFNSSLDSTSMGFMFAYLKTRGATA